MLSCVLLVFIILLKVDSIESLFLCRKRYNFTAGNGNCILPLNSACRKKASIQTVVAIAEPLHEMANSNFNFRKLTLLWVSLRTGGIACTSHNSHGKTVISNESCSGQSPRRHAFENVNTAQTQTLTPATLNDILHYYLHFKSVKTKLTPTSTTPSLNCSNYVLKTSHKHAHETKHSLFSTMTSISSENHYNYCTITTLCLAS